MNKEVFFLSDDKRYHLTAYLQEPSPEMPIWQTRPAVLIFPGGGYGITSDREADPVAFAFLAQGFHAFVLRYAVAEHATYPQPLRDASQAMKIIRTHAERWGVQTNHIAVCGFSAGGHLAASLGTLWNDPEIMQAVDMREGENKPDALILCYPMISARQHSIKEQWFTPDMEQTQRAAIIDKLSCELHAGAHTPPTFLFHTYEDETVPVEHSLLFAQALARADVPFEIHLFAKGAHGISLANAFTSDGNQSMLDSSASQWIGLATTWLWRLFGQPDSTNTVPVRPRAHLKKPVL